MTAKKRSISSQFEADLHCLTQVEDGGHRNPFAKDDPREDVYRQFTSEIANLQAHAQRIRQMPAQLVRTYIYSLKCCVETIRSLVVASADTTVPHDAADTDDEDNDAKEVAKEATRTRTTKAETVAVAAAAAAAAAATVATAAKAGKTVPKPADADTEERHLSGESDDDGDDDGDAVDSDLAGLKVLALVTEVGRTDRRYGTFCVPSARLSDADWILIMTWKERFSRDARNRLVHHTPGQQARDARLAAAMYKMIYAWKPMHEGDFDSLRVDEAIKFKFDGDNPPRSAEPYDEEDAVDDADDKIDEAVIARDIAEGNEGDNEDEAGDDEDDGYDEQAALTR